MKFLLQTFWNYDNLIWFVFRSVVMNVTVWQGNKFSKSHSCSLFFLYQWNAFLYVKITFKCVWRKHFVNFSITNGHENGRRCWFLVNFFTEKHAVSTYSFHKKIEKVLYFKSWFFFQNTMSTSFPTFSWKVRKITQFRGHVQTQLYFTEYFIWLFRKLNLKKSVQLIELRQNFLYHIFISHWLLN